MTSLRQFEANRRNARLSTGPVAEEGKKKSRRNALRHGLTAETVIVAFEDADDYAAFETTVTRDFDAQSAVERELVLRLASLLWRLRRVTAIETGLFKEQARQLLQSRGRPNLSRLCPRAISANDRRLDQENFERSISADGSSSIEAADQYKCSQKLSLAYPTCRPIRLTGSAGMRPLFGGRLAKFYSHCGAWTVASRGRGIDIEQAAINSIDRCVSRLIIRVGQKGVPQLIRSDR
jgi:hypothetical protein